MLPFTRHGSGPHPLILMHFFGSSQLEWAEVCLELLPEIPSITIDLPGFGDAANVRGYTVAEMSQNLIETILSFKLASFTLVGHSMSGKLALNIASKNILGLKEIILVGPSPPCPEPMPEKDRKKMHTFGRNRTDAQTYIDSVTAHPLKDPIVRERAIEDFIRASPDAWTAWLDGGSKEDYAEIVGRIAYPTLVISGDKDPTLSPPVQQRMVMPHLTNGQLKSIPDCGHLPMMEMPSVLVALMKEFVLGLQVQH